MPTFQKQQVMVKEIRILIILFIFLLVDFIRPLNFYFNVELLLLGIIYVSLNLPLSHSLFMSLVFGVLKDAFLVNPFPFYTLFFLIVNFFINYLLKQFHSKYVLKISIVAISIFLYSLLNTAVTGKLAPPLFIEFIVQSLVIFYIMDYFLLSWVRDLSQE
jgi:rod shape-determining protein MreD